MPANENHGPAAGAPLATDGCHSAALILIESLIHGLCQNGVLSTRQAVEIVERAAAVQSEHAEATDQAAESFWKGHALLQVMARSLSIDQ